MSQSFQPAGTSPPRSSGKSRCNRKRLDRLPLGERTDELLPRVQGYYTRLCALPRRTRRALVRQWRRSLSAIALLLALGQAPALAATIAVAPGIPPAINADGLCALIEAIDNANDDAQTHSDCVAGNGADTIVLPTKSTQSLTAVDNTTHGATGLPLITSTVTIRGRNSTIQREPDQGYFRILAVAGSGDLTLHSTTVSGGLGELDQCYPALPGCGVGGGVYNSGILTLTNSTVLGNSSYYGGGGVFNRGTATLTHSTVSGNSLGGFGPSRGGGVSNTGTLTLTHSTVSGNYAGEGGGGGVANFGTLTLTNSTVSGNYARGAGGGVANFGTLTLTNSTVSGNNDVGGGGGVYNGHFGVYVGTLTLTRALISGNTVGDFSFSDSAEVLHGGSPATIVANNSNLFGHDGNAGVGGFSPGRTDLVPDVPLSAILKPLADNGGPTKTHALPAGSPAIDASPDDADCAATDQRGVRRPQRAACDIGAFEKGPPVRCNGRIARIIGTVGNDRLTGTRGPDVIHGLAGRDTIKGLDGNDIICGGMGNDILFGGSGTDALNGGTGTDICNGGSGTDTRVSCETATSIP